MATVMSTAVRPGPTIEATVTRGDQGGEGEHDVEDSLQHGVQPARQSGQQPEAHADDGSDGHRNSRYDSVLPDAVEDPGQYVAAELVGAEQVGTAGAVQGRVGLPVGWEGRQQWSEHPGKDQEGDEDNAYGRHRRAEQPPKPAAWGVQRRF